MTQLLVLNALPLAPGAGGVSTYIREMLAALPAAWPQRRPLIAAAVQRSAAGQVPGGIEALVFPDEAGWRRALRSARGFGPADLVHGLDADLPLRPGAPAVATVHDLGVWDVPWAFPAAKARAERVIVASSLRRAAAVVAVSAFTAERLEARLGIEAVVVHEAPAPDLGPPTLAQVEELRGRYRIPERCVLHVGNLEPRKDIGTIAAACRRLGVELLLTGEQLWGSRSDLAGARWLGTVPRSDLAALYGAATVVVYASVYEGFGLPPIEAMACGAAVVSTPVPSVVEVAGAGLGAETFPAGDVDALTAILGELLADSDRRDALSAEGRRRAASLSWDRTAAGTVAVYRSLGLG
jgi:glycosyltransferase involved in cell wall biosynthesis